MYYNIWYYIILIIWYIITSYIINNTWILTSSTILNWWLWFSIQVCLLVFTIQVFSEAPFHGIHSCLWSWKQQCLKYRTYSKTLDLWTRVKRGMDWSVSTLKQEGDQGLPVWWIRIKLRLVPTTKSHIWTTYT